MSRNYTKRKVFRLSILLEITIYSFCSEYERKIEQIVISQKIDIIWKLYHT